MCVTFEEEEEMAAIAKIFDLLFAEKEKRSTEADYSAAATGSERTVISGGILTPGFQGKTQFIIMINNFRNTQINTVTYNS